MRNWMAVLAAAAVLGACAHKPQPEGIELSPAVTLLVENNFNPPAQFSVFIVPQGGGRQVLGTVSTGQTGRFTYRPTNATDRFTFVAQGASGRTMTSPPFTLINVQVARWDMSVNLVQFTEQ